MTGRIQADRQTIIGVMPGFGTLGDAEIAKILTYVSGLGDGGARPFKPVEVAAGRASSMTPSEVNALARDPAIVAVAP